MQTFLPYAGFARSAQVLDGRRLGKQRVETLQILRALHCHGYGWSSHPAVLMWRGHTAALVAYGMAIVQEWERRGHADTTAEAIAEFAHPHEPSSQALLRQEGRLPPWLGRRALHRSHRSALLRKDPAHYRAVFDDVPDDLEYVWPEPSQPPSAPGHTAATVVRGERRGADLVVPALAEEHPWIPVDRREGRVPKRARAVQRLRDLVAGDLVVRPHRKTLDLGVVRAPAVHRGDSHVLRVAWLGRLPRAALAFPAALQAPQVAFPLHDEPVLDRWADAGLAADAGDTSGPLTAPPPRPRS